jgi:beta-lactamase regulating signal transducer with metallopeptidase domain
MIHFLWIGAGIGLGSYVGRMVLRKAHPHTCYAFTLASLAVLTATPGVIFQQLYRSAPDPVALEVRPAAADSAKRAAPVAASSGAMARVASPALTTRSFPAASHSVPQYDWGAFGESLAVSAPWVWLAGTPLMLLVVGFGFVGTGRLRRHSVVVAEGWLVELCEELRCSLQIPRRVVLALNDQMVTPVLLGVLRPMILLPPALLTGYSQEQIQMVLVHELAHLRRWDALVNLMQRLIEALLFFHPVVWVVSRWVSEEREHCCDEVAIQHTGDAKAYAEALASLAAVIPPLSPATGLAMARHPLVGRIRRIVQWQERTLPRSGGVWLGVSTLVVACLALASLFAKEFSPLRSDDTGGQENSRSNVARGIVFHFPRARCVGNLYRELAPDSSWDPERVCMDYTHWEYAALARGDVSVPGDRNVQLIVHLGLRPGDAARLSAQNRLAYQMQVADRARVDPDDLSGLSGLGTNDLCWLVVSSLVLRPDADRRVLEPIRRLSGLQQLSLFGTGVTDQGMEYLRELRSLRVLEFSRELSIGNAGLAVLKDLPALEYLDLDTGATDAGFQHLAPLPNLRWLRLRTGKVWGPSLAELGKLPRLERLCLWGTVDISDRHIQYLQGLTHLKSLTVWGVADRLTDASLASIGKLKDLEELHFMRTSPRFTPAGVARLKDLKRLKKVDFDGAWSGPVGVHYGDEVVRQLAALPGLESIKGIGYLSADGVKALATFPNLKRLCIGLKDHLQNYHGPTGISHLGDLSLLEELIFTPGQALSDADLACLEPLGRLKNLLIQGPQVTDQGLASISNLGQLEQLLLFGTRVSRHGLSQLSGLRNLKELNVQMWAEVQPGDVADDLTLDLSTLRSLKKLRLSGLRLQGADVACLANLPQLEEVTIDASSLPGTSLRHLKGLSKLEYLSVRGLSRCTGQDLAQLVRLPKLRTLFLGGEIADAAVTSLNALSSLHSLTVETGDRIRDQTIADLKARLPMIEYIHIQQPLSMTPPPRRSSYAPLF